MAPYGWGQAGDIVDACGECGCYAGHLPSCETALEECPWESADECAMAAERSVAGVSDTVPGCAYHGRI